MIINVQPKNDKLGFIWNYSQPAKITCGGMTESCAGDDGVCYLINIYARRPNVFESHLKNYRQAIEAMEFNEDFELPTKVKDGDRFRTHVAGDFFVSSYVYAWIKLINNNPNVNFFAYTRSWRMSEMVESLKELGSLPNMTLLLSVDKDTGYPDKDIWAGFRTAFMMVTDEDADLVEPDTHIVFRNYRRTIKKQVNGNLVCPVENGASKKHTTCDKCQWCFKANPNKTALGGD